MKAIQFTNPWRDMPSLAVPVGGELIEYDLMSKESDAYPNLDKELIVITNESYVNGVMQKWKNDAFFWRVNK